MYQIFIKTSAWFLRFFDIVINVYKDRSRNVIMCGRFYKISRTPALVSSLSIFLTLYLSSSLEHSQLLHHKLWVLCAVTLCILYVYSVWNVNLISPTINECPIVISQCGMCGCVHPCKCFSRLLLEYMYWFGTLYMNFYYWVKY